MNFAREDYGLRIIYNIIYYYGTYTSLCAVFKDRYKVK